MEEYHLIEFYAKDIQIPVFKTERVRKWIRMIIEKEGKIPGEITFFFCSDKTMIKLNKETFSNTYYTDIITIDQVVGDIISGEIFISPETVRNNAVQYKTEFAEELRRVIIHGILHLLGFNDKNPSEKKTMRKKEDKALRLFGKWTFPSP